MKSDKKGRRFSTDVDFLPSEILQTKRYRSPTFLQEIEQDSSSSNKQKLKNGEAANSLSHSSSEKTAGGSTSLEIHSKRRRSSLPFSIGTKRSIAFSKKLGKASSEKADASTDPVLKVKESDSGFMGTFRKARRRSSTLLSGIKAFATSSHKPKTNSDVSTETISIKSKTSYDDDDVDILPYHLGYLTEAMIEEAKNELNETEEARKIGIKKLRELVKGEKKLICPQDDAFLLRFLRARKFNVENAFKLFKNYFGFRKEYDVILGSCGISSVSELYLANFLGILPKRDRFGCLVVIFRIGKWDPAIYPTDELVRAITIGLIVAIDDPATQVTGFRIIVDGRGFGWKQIKQSTPRNFHIMVKGTQSAFPGRYRAVHLLSDNQFFNIAFTTFSPLLPNKLKRRIMHHEEDVKALHAYIHPSILPTEYGGTAGPCDFSLCANIVTEKEEEILEFMKYGYQ